MTLRKSLFTVSWR